MNAWLTGLGALGFALACGAFAWKHRFARYLVAGVTFLLLAVMLFGLLIIFWPEFRRMFGYPVQFYGGLGARHGLLAAGELAGGWILCEGLRQKRRFYTVMGVLFIVGVPVAYHNKSQHDYSVLSSATDPGKITLQSNGYTCAAASLSNLTALFGPKISERGAAELMRLDNFGGAVWQIGYALQKLGYSGEEITTQRIDGVKFPALLIVAFSTNADHAILVIGRTGDEYEVVDPLAGRVQYPTAWFESRWRYQGMMGVHR